MTSRLRQPRATTQAIDRFLETVVASNTDDCLEWPFGRDKYGYGLCIRDGVRSAHRVVLVLSGRPVQPGLQSLHSCDNPPCVNPRHLRWGTVKENAMERSQRGRSNTAYGSRHGIAKLTEQIVLTMRQQYSSGGWSYSRLASEHGVSTMTAFRAVTGKTWGHLS